MLLTAQKLECHVNWTDNIRKSHLAGWLEARVGDIGDAHLLVIVLLDGDDWSVGDQGEVDPRVRHQVGPELVEDDVESTVEAKRGGDRRHTLEI